MKKLVSSENSRFVEISRERIEGNPLIVLSIIKDKSTGILYLMTVSPQSSALTPYLDKDGNPLKHQNNN